MSTTRDTEQAGSSRSRSRSRSRSKSSSSSSKSQSVKSADRQQIFEDAKREMQDLVASLVGFSDRDLRFQQGDRVICRMSGRLAPGRVLQVNARDPEDGLYVAYVVKTDALSNDLPSTTVWVPHDTSVLCVRETCLPVSLEKMSMFCARRFAKPPNLRFAPGERVSFRVEDKVDGLDHWRCGVVKEVWPKLLGPCQFEDVQFADTVPYALKADSIGERSEDLFYCHKDDHTLIRKEANMPQKRSRGVAKRMEKRILVDGVVITFDHITCRSKKAQSDSGSSDEGA